MNTINLRDEDSIDVLGEYNSRISVMRVNPVENRVYMKARMVCTTKRV